MTQKQLAELLAAIDKLGIETKPNLTKEEKELLKQLIDYVKDQIK